MSDNNNELNWNTGNTLGTGTNANLDVVRRPGVYTVTNPIGLPVGQYHLLVLRDFDGAS